MHVYMRACVRAGVFVCVCFCVFLYASETEKGGGGGLRGLGVRGQWYVFVYQLIMVIVASEYR